MKPAIFQKVSFFRQWLLLLLTFTLAFGISCQKKAAQQQVFDETLAEIVGSLRLLNREYAASYRDGKIIDAFEYEEASMALRQADRLWKKVAQALAKIDQPAAQKVAASLQDLKVKVETHADPQAISAALSGIVPLLESKISGGVSPTVQMTMASVRAADADIQGELIVDQYRIGITNFAPRSYFLRGQSGLLEVTPAAQDTHFLAVIIREKGTKRALPMAQVSVKVVSTGKIHALKEIWGDYLLYGANVFLPEGSFELEVSIAEPPKICRHGDALAAYTAPAKATFKTIRKGMELTIDAPKPLPVIADYRIGEDVEQALAETILMHEAGDYKVGFIAEGPEPIWLWKQGKLQPRAVEKADTHHLEIVLLEKKSNRIVTGAKVRLTLENERTKQVEQIEMHSLLSAFAHYGQTLKLESGPYHIQATIEPPSFGLFEKGKFATPVTVAFEWNGKRKLE